MASHPTRDRPAIALLLFSGVAAVGGAVLLASRSRRRGSVRSSIAARPPRAASSALPRATRLAAVAHELRTPLNSIVNWVHVLQSGAVDARQSAMALRSIASSARAQGRLIEDLLDAARSDSDLMPLRLAMLDVRAAIEAAADEIRPAAIAAGLTLSVVLPPAPCTIRGDIDRLQQAFGNVLANAVKFTRRGGIRVIAVERESHVEVRVVDTGKGIEPDFLPHVFERFEQADRSMRRQAGLGLGLGICRDLIERHGGSIAVASDGIGGGTTVTISLPRFSAPRSA